MPRMIAHMPYPFRFAVSPDSHKDVSLVHGVILGSWLWIHIRAAT
jgi:hypothetical protein